MAEIDSLEIKIEGSARKANDAIDDLINNLGRLANSLNIDTKGLEKIGKSLNLSGITNGTKAVTAQIKQISKSAEKAQTDIGQMVKEISRKSLFLAPEINTSNIQGEIKKYENQLINSKNALNRLMIMPDAEKQVKQITILTAKINEAENALNRIAEINGKYQESLARTNTEGLENTKDKMEQVATSAEKMGEQVRQSISYVGSMPHDSEGMQKFIDDYAGNLESKTKQFEQSLKNLQIPPINTENINALQRELAKAESNIEKLRAKLANGIAMGRISANVDDKGFRNLREQMALSEKTAEALKERIKQVQNASNQTSTEAKKLGDSVKSASGSILGLANSSTRAIKPLNNLGSSFRNLLRTILPILGIRQIFNWGKQAVEISSDLTEVQNVVDVTFGNMAYKVEDFAETSIEQFGMSELALKEFSSRFQAMGTAMGFTIDKMSDMSIELTKLTADMASFYNVEQKAVAEDLAAIFTGQTRPLRTYGLDLTQATLQEWALKQGIDANMQSMSQAEKTMLRYQYVMANTGASQGDFVRTMNTWANQVRILKMNFQQLASVVGGTLVNAFKPIVKAVNAAMSAIIAFAKTISNALGKIFGWTYEEGGGGLAQDFEDAAGSAENLAGSTGDAAKNAKKLRQQLQAFDELNVLTTDKGSESGSGGGAGGGIGAGAGGAGGKWVPGESILKGFESEIDSLYALGKYIGESLSKAMDSINWDSVYEKARNFGKGLADFLNGLISPDLFGSLGRTIAGALNTAVYSALSFGMTFDWKDFGLSIANGINEFFRTFDFGALAETLNAWATGILNAAITAINNTNWGKIGTRIGEFLATIDILKIIGKIAVLVKKAAKSFVDAWVGVLKKAPLETLLISLWAIPKALKAIISSKFITGIAKIANNFVKFGKNTMLVTSALLGNQAAVSTISASYPRLGKAVDVARKAFASFRLGIENGNFITGLNAGIKTIRNNLTGLQKGAITAVAGFAEFNIVSDAFKGLTLGTENVVAGLAKIGVAVAAAGAAMYVALGPAGLAIAAITGVVAAVKGINDAFDTIRAQEIGETIKNAMSNPGGVPLSEITSGFANALSEAASGFDTIKEKSSEMDSVQKNIQGTWTEIYKIQEAMENGVLSVEEGKERLETLFSELATLAEQKFSTMNTVIMSAYGEGGSFRTALENMGADTETAIDTMITYGYQNSERAKEIAQELAGMDINSEEYRTLTAELASLTGEMSSFEKATSDFTYNMNSLQGKIDYSEIFLEDGSIDTETLQNYLNEATTALSDYETSLDDAGKEIRQYWQEIYNSTTATDEQKAVAKENLDYIPQAIEAMKSDAELQIVGFTDTMQNEFLARTSQIIDDSVTEWESKNAFEKWWNGIWGAGTKGEYVKKAVDQQQANIQEVSSAIEESLGGLQTEGVVWASDAAKEIYGALFDSEYIHSEVGIGHYKYDLNEDYREIIEGATEGISELAKERGKDATDGYASGFSDETNIQNAQNEAKSFTEKVIETIAKTQDSNSPSKVTMALGKDATDGYAEGFRDSGNIANAQNAVSEFTSNVLNKFSEVIAPLNQIGIDAMQGLLNGLSSMESSIYAKADEIAKNVANTIKTALDIHSPSRVMFELGDYTMQGFQNGLESLYKPILSSTKIFSRDLQVASAPSISDMYGGYQNQAAYTPQYDAAEYAQNGYYQSNAETNALLRRQNELLERILAKPNLSNGDVFNAARTVYKGEAIRRYGNSAAFDPVWG